MVSLDLPFVPVPLHPGGGLPHAETLGVPVWVQWGLVAVVVAAVGWLLLDVSPGGEERDEARTGPGGDPDDAPFAGEALVLGHAPGRAEVAPPAAPAPVEEHPRVPERSDQPPAPRRAFNPLRVLAAVLGLALGLLAIDQVRAVEAVAQLMRTDTSARVAWLGWLWVVLTCVGGALAIPAPRAAALVFLASAALGGFLASADRWERRLEWWDAPYLLLRWERLPLWAGAAAVLALLAFLGAVYRPRRLPLRRPVARLRPRLDRH